MQPNVEVTELCRHEGINPTQYYGWKKQLLSSATKVFDDHVSKRDASEEKRDADLRRMTGSCRRSYRSGVHGEVEQARQQSG